MNDRGSSPTLTRTIAAVERDTGLSKDTLRVWERRYGFPTPGRDQFGERVYPMEQVDKLRLLRRLMDAGHRPGKVIHLPVEDLQRYIALVKAHDGEGLRRALSQAQLRLGLERFVVEVVAPLTRMIGEAWARGYVEVFEEHMYTESLQVVLRGAIGTIPQPARLPRVLLTTIPLEPHGLGLLMAEAILALDGCRCVSLGVQTPVWDIVLAATAHRADVVALSFTGVVNQNQVLDSLTELRQKLPPTVELWVGGNCPILQRRPPPGIRVLADLQAIHPAIRRWRDTHPYAA